MKPNLENYLKENYEKGIIDHAIRVSHIDQSGKPHFYIHPHGHNGDTLDFVVNENWITQKHVGEDNTSFQPFGVKEIGGETNE